MILILASASPRRREILEEHGQSPVVIPSNIEESLPEGRVFSPEETAMYLAEQKAEAVAEELKRGVFGAALRAAAGRAAESAEGAGNFLVLAVDTIVYKDRIIGKPRDEEDALNILRSLKNAAHDVISGVCLIELAQNLGPCRPRFKMCGKQVFFDSTTVTFGDYTDGEILAYIRANPPYDKSGSYAIQSNWGSHVISADGSIFNVIGLPWERIEPFL
ncbi:MAG: Maf family protein [Clostridiales Family XIII bacterium]|jgi:septum formation protein|nr:Maf family protein [Clostridiales Family XIII bacterium]